MNPVQSPSPAVSLVDALRAIKPDASLQDLYHGCRELIEGSDLYHCATPERVTAAERDALAEAVFQYITDPFYPGFREIVFETKRRLVGNAIEYEEFAAMYSSDMLSQNLSTKFHQLDAQELFPKLSEFFAGLAFRYRCCISSAGAEAFQVSFIVDYTNAAGWLFPPEQRKARMSRILEATVLALETFDERWPHVRVRSPL